MKVKELFRLDGSVAIVTGSARGLGKNMALALSEAGSDVVIADVLFDEVENTVKEIENNGKRALGVQLDVTNPKEAEEMVEKVLDRFGRIDILINNAGINIISAAEKFELKDWEKVLSINLTGVFICAKAVGRAMFENKSGKIINIASIFGTVGSPHGAVAYNSTKAGVINLTRSLALEWAKYNINVNAIAPGMIETALTKERLKNKEYHDYWIDRTPLGIGKPDDLLGAIVYLSTRASDWMTGQTLVIDGGYTAQ